MENKDTKTVEFEYKIGDIVILRPVDGGKDNLDLFGQNKIRLQVQYRVISRIYEELTQGGGIVCYAVRHIDVESPGGGKIYKFQEDELMLHSSYQALLKLMASVNSPAKGNIIEKAAGQSFIPKVSKHPASGPF